jgi:MFS family permease
MSERSAGGGPARSAWLTLGGAFTAFTLSAALMHSYPVYLVAFIAEFGWSRGETSIAYSVSQLVAGVSSPLVGFLVDRLGPRRLLLLGGGLLVAAVALFRAAPRHGDLDRAIGQRHRPRHLGAIGAIADLADRLAHDLYDPGRADGGPGIAARGIIPPRRSAARTA